jgi:hypothetical protein
MKSIVESIERGLHAANYHADLLAASLTTRLDKSRSDGWCFWPCDEHGNKVRWPTDAEGNML